MQEKREHQRVDKKMKSEVHSADGVTFSTTMDMSRGGIFISTPEPVKDGSEIDLSIYIPGDHPVNIKGIVRWMNEEPVKGDRAGMGIEFVDVSDKDIGKIKEAMNS